MNILPSVLRSKNCSSTFPGQSSHCVVWWLVCYRTTLRQLGNVESGLALGLMLGLGSGLVLELPISNAATLGPPFCDIADTVIGRQTCDQEVVGLTSSHSNFIMSLGWLFTYMSPSSSSIILYWTKGSADAWLGR